MKDTGKLFSDRQEAAKKLAAQLRKYRNSDALILGIPRGGAEIGYHLAAELNLEFSVVVAMKLMHPVQEDLAIGAVCEEGTVYMADAYKEMHGSVETEILRLRSEILRRVLLYRDGKPLPEMKGRIVILADDLIATGVTAASAFLLCVRHGAAEVIVAVPVCLKNYAADLAEADAVKVLREAESMDSISDQFSRMEQVTDEKIIYLIRRYADKAGI